MVTYIAAGDYAGSCRDVARGVSALDPEALRLAAARLAALLPRGAVLIPVPSHTGRARQTLVLCRVLQAFHGFRVRDALTGGERESLRALKHTEAEGGLAPGSLMPPAQSLGMRFEGIVPEGAVLIDNVVASGTTAKAAGEAVPGAPLFCIACDRGYPKVEGVRDGTQEYIFRRTEMRAAAQAEGAYVCGRF